MRPQLVMIAACCLLLILATAFAAAEPVKIAVMDLALQSDDPQKALLGKGMAEYLALELARSPDMAVISREARNAAFTELGIGLSDQNEAQQRADGEKLSARYFVTGTILDLGIKLIVNISLYDVEKGAVIFSARSEPACHNTVVASLTHKILGFLGLGIPESIRAQIENPINLPIEAATHFSAAVDAFDRKDEATAKRELAEAQKYDPASVSVKLYLSKLMVNTAKFKLLNEIYYPFTNPAYLGIIQFDKITSSFAGTFRNFVDAPAFFNFIDTIDIRFNAGYQFPIGRNFGMSIESNFNYSRFQAASPLSSPPPAWSSNLEYYNGGGIISFGWAPSDTFSCGLGLALYYQSRRMNYTLGAISDPIQNDIPIPAVTLGLLFKNPDSTVIYDLMAGYPFTIHIRIDPYNSGAMIEVLPPLFLENTLTLALADRRVFLVFKQIDEIGFDRKNFLGRIVAAGELWPFDWLGIRVSTEGSLGLIETQTNLGWGVGGGITFRIPGTGWSGWDFEIGVSYLMRPSQMIEGVVVAYALPYVSITKSASCSRPADRFISNASLAR